jgi:hypothetical protein
MESGRRCAVAQPAGEHGERFAESGAGQRGPEAVARPAAGLERGSCLRIVIVEGMTVGEDARDDPLPEQTGDGGERRELLFISLSAPTSNMKAGLALIALLGLARA